MVKNPPAMWVTWVGSLGWEDPLEKGMVTHSSIFPWRIPWTEEPGRLQSLGLQKVRHDWITKHTTYLECIKDNCIKFSCLFLHCSGIYIKYYVISQIVTMHWVLVTFRYETLIISHEIANILLGFKMKVGYMVLENKKQQGKLFLIYYQCIT